MENCKNCDYSFEGKYCNNCGQKLYTEKDKNLKGIFEEVLHFMTHFEGTLFTTLKAILFKPGKMSLDYCNGIRKKYYKPMSFFLLLVVLYMLFPLFEGLNMRLDYYPNLLGTGPMIAKQIEAKAAAMHITESELAEIFHHKSEKTAKILLLLLIPLTAGALSLLFFGKRRAFDFFILATEINSFIILFVFLIAPILMLPLILIFGETRIMENVFGIPLMVVLLFYSAVLLRNFLGLPWIKAIGKALLLLLCYAVITQIIYKTLLFEVTLFLIH
jgi:hypothetical protein